MIPERCTTTISGSTVVVSACRLTIALLLELGRI
jgi:hypothetical protein